MHTYMLEHARAHLSVCMSLSMYLYACIYVCVYAAGSERNIAHVYRYAHTNLHLIR